MKLFLYFFLMGTNISAMTNPDITEINQIITHEFNSQGKRIINKINILLDKMNQSIIEHLDDPEIFAEVDVLQLEIDQLIESLEDHRVTPQSPPSDNEKG